MTDKQVQRGTNGPQIQAGRNVIYYQGIDVNTVKEIYEAKTILLRQELTEHANTMMQERLNNLEEKLLQRFTDPELLPAFADADFQFNILEAQRSAARSGSVDDLDLLIDVLAQRASNLGTPRLKMATRRALDVVGQVSTVTLSGLTVLWYGVTLSPVIDDINSGLQHMEDQLRPLVEVGLPTDRYWLTDLAELGCLQVSVGGLGNLKSFTQLVAENKYPGPTALGFDQPQADDLRARLKASAPGMEGLVIPHPFEAGRFCLAGRNEQRMQEIVASNAKLIAHQGDFDAALSDAVSQNNYVTRVANWMDSLNERIKTHPGLLAVNEWWNNFPAIQVTSVGVALGYANIKRVVPGVQLKSINDLF